MSTSPRCYHLIKEDYADENNKSPNDLCEVTSVMEGRNVAATLTQREAEKVSLLSCSMS